MGLYDRDYIRQPSSSGVGTVRLWSITTWLIVINVAVFLIEALMTRPRWEITPDGTNFVQPHDYILQWGAFSIQSAIYHLQLWRLITFQFLHAGLWHIVVNMIGLWMFGPVVELNLGSRRFALFYFACGIAGPIMFTILWSLGILMPDVPYLPGSTVPLVGASAGIFGVLMAAAYLSPDRLIYLYFFDMPLKVFAWIMMALAAYTVLINGGNAGGQAAHLGGGLLGFFLIRQEQLLDLVMPKRTVRGRRVKDWSRDFNR